MAASITYSILCKICNAFTINFEFGIIFNFSRQIAYLNDVRKRLNCRKF